jgi:hypothetical protein
MDAGSAGFFQADKGQSACNSCGKPIEARPNASAAYGICDWLLKAGPTAALGFFTSVNVFVQTLVTSFSIYLHGVAAFVARRIAGATLAT